MPDKTVPPMKNPELSLEIVDIALPDGYGVGKKGTFVFFVHGAVVGDQVTIRVIKEDKRFSYGEIIEIEQPSPFRCEPQCPHFGPCGGCVLQHLTYEKQLEIKENNLRQTLGRIGGIDISSLDMMPIVPSPEQYFSRNKIELAFGKDKNHVTLGFRERVNPAEKYKGRVIPIQKCLIFSKAAETIIPLVLNFVKRHGLLPYDPLTKKGFLRHLVLREAKSTGDLMVILETTRGELPGMGDLWRALSEALPKVKSLYRVINTQSIDTGRYEAEEHLFGERSIEESIGNFRFNVYPQSFFQPNTKVAEMMYRTIIDLSEPDINDRVLGLYCGAGPIEIFFSSKVREVTGIDSNPSSIASARENCRLNGVENCTFIEGRLERFRERLPLNPDILVIDPPRGGISKEGLTIIQGLKPEKIVYVSCNPSTLARDIRYLREHRYMPKRIASFDAFPHTTHLESVTIIEKI
ncbi:MAG: 23S rRNA (uracil(1939)-C(5))-methyltransferase RlmD [Syntrophus sp. (in: bacteria)]|nr:23S rRNA (uracil(1939)-C(5))-methyltransferase RlmD [Syntrophus sp. (in: bacteria)]